MAYEFRFKDGRVQSLTEASALTEEQVTALLDGLAHLVWIDRMGEVTVLAGEDPTTEKPDE